MAAKFVLKRSANGKYHFNLQAANGEIIATSELYETKASAQKGIESVRVNAPRATLDDRSEQQATSAAGPAPAKPQPPQAAPRPAQAAPKPKPPQSGPRPTQAVPKPAPPQSAPSQSPSTPAQA